MHTDLLQAENNLMISMRSSPFGSTSHAHADQNGFNIQFGGDKLFYNSGYRPSMGVPHYEQWFKATIGHNTVLIDGKGQPVGSGESYGWIPRFLHGETISYALGDASKAYDNRFNERQNAGVKLFRRHLVFLRPSIVVIYDELEADHNAESPFSQIEDLISSFGKLINSFFNKYTWMMQLLSFLWKVPLPKAGWISSPQRNWRSCWVRSLIPSL